MIRFFIFVFLPSISIAINFAGGGGGCGCADDPPACPPFPKCLSEFPGISVEPVTLLPCPDFPCGACAPTLPPLPPLLCPPPKNCQCGRKKRAMSTHAANEATLCNSQELRSIILNNITADPAASRKAIHKEAKIRLEGAWGVICSQGESSLTVESDIFCADGTPLQTCHAFQI